LFHELYTKLITNTSKKNSISCGIVVNFRPKWTIINTKVFFGVQMNKKQEDRDNTIDLRLWKLMDHTVFVINRTRKKELGLYGLTPEKAYVLDILHRSGGSVTIQKIADITMRRHNSISTLVNRMVKQGYVEKTKDPEDGRQYNVTITEKGQALFDVFTTNTLMDIFSILSEKDKSRLEQGLKELRDNAYRVLGQEYEPNIISD
jgi:DNA-binding MarR family transcriptional regulator